MNSLLKNIIIVIMSLAGLSAVYAQDAVYSQFYLSPVLMNPALAGNTYNPNVNIIYRNQWPSINNAYVNYSISYDQQWKRNSGIGLYISNDDAGNGAIKTTKISAVYSYKVRLNKNTYLKGAIEGGYGQTRLDWEQLVFFDSLDPQFGAVSPGGVTIPSAEIPRNNLARSFFDVGSGLMIYNPLWYIGVSAKHLNSPSIDFVADQTDNSGQLPTLLSFQGGMQIDIEKGNRNREGTFISPNLLASFQEDFWQVTAGAYLSVDRVFGGLWYRQGGRNVDAVITSIGIKTDRFKIGYSFDYTISELSIASGGAHEIGLSIIFAGEKKKDFPYSDCLNLFR